MEAREADVWENGMAIIIIGRMEITRMKRSRERRLA